MPHQTKNLARPRNSTKHTTNQKILLAEACELCVHFIFVAFAILKIHKKLHSSEAWQLCIHFVFVEFA